MIRRIGMPPVKHQTYTLRPGAYAILVRDTQVLLTCHMVPQPDVQLPGGRIDPGESPLTALHREVAEETGWRIGKPVRLGAFRRFVFMPEYDLWAEKMCRVYVARPAYQLSEPTEPDHRAIWMTPLEASHTLGNEGDQMFLCRYFGLPVP